MKMFLTTWTRFTQFVTWRASTVPWLVGLAVLACGSSGASSESGQPDSGGADVAADGHDASVDQEAEVPEASSLDRNVEDVSTSDAGSGDVQVEADAFVDASEAGIQDAGDEDAGVCQVWDPSGRPKLTIEHALFGAGNTWADYGSKFQALVRHDWLYYHVYRTYIDMGDPVPGKDKLLRLSYRLDGKLQPEKAYREGEIIYINVPPQNLACCDWQLLSAKWGANPSSAIDVTAALKKHILDCKLDFYCFSGNQLGGDPAHGKMKHMYISYRINGSTKQFVCNEEGANNHISIP